MYVPGEVKFRILSLVFLYTVITVTPVIITGGLTQYQYITEIGNEDFNMDLASASATLYFSFLHLIPFTHWVEMPKIVTFFNNWKQFQVFAYLLL